MKVRKWGNSLAVRLPSAVVEALALEDGADIEIHIAGARTFQVAKAPSKQDLLKRLHKYRGRMPADFRFDRIEANGRDQTARRHQCRAVFALVGCRHG